MFQEHSHKEEDKPTAFSTPKPDTAPKKITVVKLRRSSAMKSSEPTAKTETAVSELDVDLLLSPLEERKMVGGASVERKMSIAEMKAEM